jgi:glutathione S-transferase
MKLYDSIGPNPRVVRMFLAEKGISLPVQTVDLAGGENREPAHLARNPHGQMPTLELHDGRRQWRSANMSRRRIRCRR